MTDRVIKRIVFCHPETGLKVRVELYAHETTIHTMDGTSHTCTLHRGLRTESGQHAQPCEPGDTLLLDVFVLTDVGRVRMVNMDPFAW
jgi:hypothetical protein